MATVPAPDSADPLALFQRLRGRPRRGTVPPRARRSADEDTARRAMVMDGQAPGVSSPGLVLEHLARIAFG